MRFSLGHCMVLGLAFLALVTPSAAAASVTDESRTPIGDIIRPMFMQIVWVSVVIGVIVWGILVYALIRFRRRKDSPKDSPNQTHGNNKLEIAWTIAPALVMAWLLVISYNGLLAIDGPGAPEPDFTVEAYGSRFQWEFVYPDGTSGGSTLRVEEDHVVGIIVKSRDVIHALRIADLDVMVDAIPGENNYVWFEAYEPGEHKAACFQFCGEAHGEMEATVQVFAAGSQSRPWGEPPSEAPEEPPQPGGNQTGGNQTGGDQTVPEGAEEKPITLVDFEITDTESFRVEPGQTVAFMIDNEGPSQHNYFIGTFGPQGDANRQVLAESETINQGESTVLVFEFPAEEGQVDVWCDVAGHAQLGMLRKLGVGQEPDAGGSGEDPILPGPSPLALLVAVGAAVVLVRARRRR